MVIDPSPLFRRAARNFIGALPGCEGLVAASLGEALDSAAARDVGLVLIDWSLCRDADGAPRRLRALAPAARVLLLTGEDAADYRQSGLAAGADGCLAKDALGRELPRIVAALAPQTARAAA
jgi:DNA-binding NarL/FixJ family response regulator